MRRALLLAFALLPAAMGTFPISAREAEMGNVPNFLGGAATEGFAIATPRRLEFPADHGAHPAFRTEWWYFTGNLAAADGRHFGFELTFFRFALAPHLPDRASAWATNQAWMAHFTLTDTANARMHQAERTARGALGLAGADPQPFRVWLDRWQAVSVAPEGGLFPLRLSAAEDETAIELTLTSLKPLVLQGDQGFDRKGPEPGAASYYYSYTRLAARGHVEIGGQRFAVEGTAWMDREWSTSALGRDLAGWDWFGLQLSDGSDLMFYRLRRKDGSAGEFSSGSLVLADGEKIALSRDEVRLTERRRWKSPRDGRSYPVAWTLEVPGRGISLEIEPRVDDQEVDLSVRYWEGAVRARGIAKGRPAEAEGYLELVGY